MSKKEGPFSRFVKGTPYRKDKLEGGMSAKERCEILAQIRVFEGLQASR